MFKILYSGRQVTPVGWQFIKNMSHLTELVCFPIFFPAPHGPGSLAANKIVFSKIMVILLKKSDKISGFLYNWLLCCWWNLLKQGKGDL
jgi:hypothetical protein